MKCPHCDKTNREKKLETAWFNADAYGSSRFVFQCKYCKKKYSIYIKRVTRIKYSTIAKAEDDANLSF